MRIKKAVNETTDFKKHLMAFAAGVTFVIMLYFIGDYISRSITPINVQQTNEILWISIFVGISTGHYLGTAARKEGGQLNSFLIGIFSSLTVAVAGITMWSNLTGVLIFATVSIFLMHASGIVEGHEGIERLMKIFAQYISGFILTLIGISKYVGPLISLIQLATQSA